MQPFSLLLKKQIYCHDAGYPRNFLPFYRHLQPYYCSYILRKKVAPYYYKVKFSLVNAIWCLLFGWIIINSSSTYDRIWLVVFLLLMFWYAVILILNWPSKKTT